MNVNFKNMPLFFLFIISMSDCIHAMDVNEVNPGYKVNESVQKINDNFFTTQKEEDLFLGMIRLTEENCHDWFRFEKKEMKLAGKWFQGVDIPAEGITKTPNKSTIHQHLLVGVMGFRDALASYVMYQNKSPHEVWILLAANAPVTEQILQDSPLSIEMYCTVSTSQDVPFTTHMGYSRCAQFIEKFGANQKHKNRVKDVHSFGAMVMRMLYPLKIYMLSTPMPIMMTIFRTTLGAENIHFGFDGDWPEYIQRLEAQIVVMEKDCQNQDSLDLFRLRNTIKLLQDNVKSCGENPILKIDRRGVYKSRSFQLKDLTGNMIMDLKEDEMYGQYAWYFERETTYSASPANNMMAIPLDCLVKVGNL